MTPFAVTSTLRMSGHSGCHDNHRYLVVFSVTYALLAQKFSRRVNKTIPKSDYQLRHVCPSAHPCAWNSSAHEIRFRRGVAEAFALLGCYAA